MISGKLKAVVFILVFLLILALTAHWALEMDAKRHPQPDPEPEETAQPVEPPVQETPTPITPDQTWAPAPTPVPANRPAPTPAPTKPPQQQQPQQQPTAPTPAPTPEPRPAGQNLGSGSFSSQTGTQLKLVCDWSAVSIEGNKAQVTLNVSIESAAISLNDMGKNIFVRVGDQSASMAQPVMSHDGGTIRTPVGTETFTLSLDKGSSFPVAVEWHYNGSYSGVQMDVIECGGTINLG